MRKIKQYEVRKGEGVDPHAKYTYKNNNYVAKRPYAYVALAYISLTWWFGHEMISTATRTLNTADFSKAGVSYTDTSIVKTQYNDTICSKRICQCIEFVSILNFKMYHVMTYSFIVVCT